jgi:hypothetical protein
LDSSGFASSATARDDAAASAGVAAFNRYDSDFVGRGHGHRACPDDDHRHAALTEGDHDITGCEDDDITRREDDDLAAGREEKAG